MSTLGAGELQAVTSAQPSSTLPPDLARQVHDALVLWHRDPALGSPLGHLAAVQEALARPHSNLRKASNQALIDALQALAQDYPRDADLLRQRYVDALPAHVLARKANVAEVTIHKWQKQAIKRLAEILWAGETQAQQRRRARLLERLEPATYTRLFGVDQHIRRLSQVLQTPGPPHLIALEGLGGIGKTALADALLRHAIGAGLVQDFAWVSARQQVLDSGGALKPLGRPAMTADRLIEALADQLLPDDARPASAPAAQLLASLQGRLQRGAHLLVVDNLETVVDVESLLPALRRLAGPAKFLLTTRQGLQAEPDVFHFSLPELSLADSLALVRFEAGLRNLEHVLAAGDDDLRPIYATVGGNPLALKLVTGQLYLLPLALVLENLRAARDKSTEELYRYIYWTAWQRLDATAREVLLTMPLFSQEGADFAAVERVCDVQGAELLAALRHLASLCLVNVAGPALDQRRFSIHRLTETFVLTDVIHWRVGGDQQPNA